METAMNELIQRLKSLSEKYHSAGLITAMDIAKQLLAKEHGQILHAWWAGHDARDGAGLVHVPEDNAMKFFDETYNTP